MSSRSYLAALPSRCVLSCLLQNGNKPASIMPHMAKIFQAINALRLDTDKPAAGVRPKALGMESSVGVEYVAFKTPLAPEGKVG